MNPEAPTPRGRPLPEWERYTQKQYRDPKTGEPYTPGFRDPNGEYFYFRPGEELVHIKVSNDNEDRTTFIRDQYGNLWNIDYWRDQYRREGRGHEDELR